MRNGKGRASRVAALNDDLRDKPSKPLWVFTPGITALGPDFVRKTIEVIRAFDAFDANNDPYGEHDFAHIKVDGVDVLFKLDYYEKGSNYTEGASDPANAESTDRILTVMLPDEY